MYKQLLFTAALTFAFNASSFANPIINGGPSNTPSELKPNGGALAPVANDDNASGPQNRDIVIDPLANDSLNGPISGSPSVVVQAQHGTAVWSNAEQAFIYTPAANYCGTDLFSYVITNGAALSDTAMVNISVACVDSVTVYNGISPNGDGYNDYLTIANIESFPNNSLYVYNRWGNLVFQTKSYSNVDANKRFNGQWEGSDLIDGTYFYVLRFVNRQGTEEIKNGCVIINR